MNRSCWFPYLHNQPSKQNKSTAKSMTRRCDLSSQSFAWSKGRRRWCRTSCGGIIFRVKLLKREKNIIDQPQHEQRKQHDRRNPASRRKNWMNFQLFIVIASEESEKDSNQIWSQVRQWMIINSIEVYQSFVACKVSKEEAKIIRSLTFQQSFVLTRFPRFYYFELSSQLSWRMSMWRMPKRSPKQIADYFLTPSTPVRRSRRIEAPMRCTTSRVCTVKSKIHPINECQG